ncbi:hypothetical protein NE237_024601 [Protea cynaroides]|uniref:Uncharacterized protein n=1 Tax=Protea cynaroides TaxID=273540 RepID=A0A9Q0H3N1_9MAGN|nr:hypothetical protein NE237_024601 [Protea cynaroides]
MKNTSKLVMGMTLAMMVSLTIVLTLVLVLLAQLYCPILLRRRRLRTTNETATSQQSSHQESSSVPPPLNSIYAQGVLDAPRRFLYPAVIGKEEKFSELELHQVVGEEIISTPPRIGLITGSPSPSIKSLASPRPIKEAAATSVGNGGGDAREHFVYISNPIYDNDACRVNRVGVGVGTPFETPDTSPSRLEMSSDEEEEDAEVKESSSSSPKSLPMTPPLTPMKKLPVVACSVSLRDARSIGNSGSGSDTKKGSSSSSSGTPCTSPSW